MKRSYNYLEDVIKLCIKELKEDCPNNYILKTIIKITAKYIEDKITRFVNEHTNNFVSDNSNNINISSFSDFSIDGYFDNESKRIYLKHKITELENEINNYKEQLNGIN